VNKVVRFSAGRACIQSMVYLQQHLEAGFAFPSSAEDIPAEKKATYYFQIFRSLLLPKGRSRIRGDLKLVRGLFPWFDFSPRYNRVGERRVANVRW